MKAHPCLFVLIAVFYIESVAYSYVIEKFYRVILFLIFLSYVKI